MTGNYGRSDCPLNSSWASLCAPCPSKELDSFKLALGGPFSDLLWSLQYYHQAFLCTSLENSDIRARLGVSKWTLGHRPQRDLMSSKPFKLNYTGLPVLKRERWANRCGFLCVCLFWHSVPARMWSLKTAFLLKEISTWIFRSAGEGKNPRPWAVTHNSWEDASEMST